MPKMQQAYIRVYRAINSALITRRANEMKRNLTANEKTTVHEYFRLKKAIKTAEQNQETAANQVLKEHVFMTSPEWDMPDDRHPRRILSQGSGYLMGTETFIGEYLPLLRQQEIKNGTRTQAYQEEHGDDINGTKPFWTDYILHREACFDILDSIAPEIRKADFRTAPIKAAEEALGLLGKLAGVEL